MREEIRVFCSLPMGLPNTGLLHSVSAIMAACGRRVTRASRRLRNSGRLRSLQDCGKIASSWAPHLSRRISTLPLPGGRKKKEGSGGGEHKGRRGRKRTGYEEEEGSSSEEEEEVVSYEGEGEEKDGVWQRNILMGEKCQPLDFSGVIYYDDKGRRLRGPRRSPLRSPLPSSPPPPPSPPTRI